MLDGKHYLVVNADTIRRLINQPIGDNSDNRLIIYDVYLLVQASQM